MENSYGFKLILRFDGNDEDDDVQTVEEVILEGSMGNTFIWQSKNTKLFQDLLAWNKS